MAGVVAAATADIGRLKSRASSLRSWRFDRVEDQWLHDNLADLVTRLEALDGPSEHGCTVLSVRERLATALDLKRRTLVEPAAAWREAVASIGSDPAYGGLRLEPVLGLVPLGRDPGSRLWEFAHVQSGALPARDAAGRLVMTADTALVLVLVPGGVATMGARAPSGPGEMPGSHVDPEARPQEQPPHDVRLDAFLISKFEMTQGQWLRAAGSNPSHASPGRAFEHGYRPVLTNPVEHVSFEDCVEVLGRLGLTLPTEAQWERAARGGTTTPWWPGSSGASFARAENLADRTFDAAEQAGYAHD
jgi:hypothetical protein